MSTLLSVDFSVTNRIHGNKCVVATCNLNQWALDFDDNLAHIVDSIKQAKAQGARLRVGPELEICGYSCEDHFREIDTYEHSEQSLAAILSDKELTKDIICDIGMPVMYNNVRYNCRVFVLNSRILLIRPKAYLANDGNYHEPRHFRSWKANNRLDDFQLSEILQKATDYQQKTAPFGMAYLNLKDTKIAAEVCEELWTPNSPHVQYCLSGVEIFTNGSGSHHQLRKLDARVALMQSATRKCGGVYLYANQRGCDGTRLYFDGSSLISINGNIVKQASQFSLEDVEVISACIDLEEIRSYRGGVTSLQEQASLKLCEDDNHVNMFPCVDVSHFSLQSNNDILDASSNLESDMLYRPSLGIGVRLHTPEEECALGPACWLWDYLRRSGASGYLLPLSGGADSASVCSIVRVMCLLTVLSLTQKNAAVKADLERMCSSLKDEINAIYNSPVPIVASTESIAVQFQEMPAPALQLANNITNYILHTVYLGTVNSSVATNDRALALGTTFNTYHVTLSIDPIVSAILSVFTTFTGGKTPKFKTHGGSWQEDIALQNIQARIRMVMSYLCAQLFPWYRDRKGFLLVLGSGNVDEALRGYMTKYDCSSADVNPIGGICKTDLKKLLLWGSDALQCSALSDIVHAPPSAELQPIENEDKAEYTQTDEDDMGMTYNELGTFGYLRKVMHCGPVSMFRSLCDLWTLPEVNLSIEDIAEKVKKFFFYYSMNRHKLTTLTPSYHAENYSPDDNRFDFRPFLYNIRWHRQFANIDALVEEHRKSGRKNAFR